MYFKKKLKKISIRKQISYNCSYDLEADASSSTVFAFLLFWCVRLLDLINSDKNNTGRSRKICPFVMGVEQGLGQGVV